LLVLISGLYFSDAHAVIEDSTEYGSLQVGSEVYEIVHGKQTMVKASGTVNDVYGGGRLNLVVVLPDGLTDGIHTSPTSSGYFETFWMLDDQSQLGQYKVIATYEGVTLGEVTFEVKEKVYSGEELLTARQILDQIQEESESTSEESTSIPETEQPEMVQTEKEEVDLYEEGLAKLNQQKYQEALELFNQALIDDPQNTKIQNSIENAENKIRLEKKCSNALLSTEQNFDIYSECCELEPSNKIQDCKQEVTESKQRHLEEKAQQADSKTSTIPEKSNLAKNVSEKIPKKQQGLVSSNTDEFTSYLIAGGIGIGIVIAIKSKFKKRSIPPFVTTTSHITKQKSGDKMRWEGI